MKDVQLGLWKRHSLNGVVRWRLMELNPCCLCLKDFEIVLGIFILLIKIQIEKLLAPMYSIIKGTDRTDWIGPCVVPFDRPRGGHSSYTFMNPASGFWKSFTEM
jgi:hypothetical protein